MRKVIFLVPENCLECQYFEKFEYLENGVSKPIEIPASMGGTAKITVTLNADGSKKYIGRCGVYGGLIHDGDEQLKKYHKSIFEPKKECYKTFPEYECTEEQIKSANNERTT